MNHRTRAKLSTPMSRGSNWAGYAMFPFWARVSIILFSLSVISTMPAQKTIHTRLKTRRMLKRISSLFDITCQHGGLLDTHTPRQLDVWVYALSSIETCLVV